MSTTALAFAYRDWFDFVVDEAEGRSPSTSDVADALAAIKMLHRIVPEHDAIYLAERDAWESETKRSALTGRAR